MLPQHYVVLIVTTLIFFDSSNGSLHLSQNVSEVERLVNDSLAMACHGGNVNNTMWRGPTGQPITNTTGRVHVEQRQDGKDTYLTLMIENINRPDKGNYSCSGTLNGTQHKVVFRLIVVKPVSVLGVLSEQNVTENQNALVRCEMTGDPAPSVIWQVKGKPLNGSNPRYKQMLRGLYITNVTREDAGHYLCRGLQLTTQDSLYKDQHISLHVHYKPVWRTNNKAEMDLFFGFMGGVANLSCEVDAAPEAEFLWTRNSSTLHPDLKVISEPNRSVLQVPMVNRSVLGQYECKAWNGIGDELWKKVSLLEGVKPSRPIRISVGTVEDHKVSLHLHSLSKDKVIGYRVQFVKRYPSFTFDSPEYQDVYLKNGFPYIIYNLSDNTDYMFRVASRNVAGLSDFSEEYHFRTLLSIASSGSHLHLSWTSSLLSLSFVILKKRTIIDII